MKSDTSHPIPPASVRIPVERIVRELIKSAQPGYYGQTEIRLSLTDQSLAGVTLNVQRQRTVRSSDQVDKISAAERDTPREMTVQNLGDGLKDQLLLRLKTVRIVGHFADGFCSKCEIVDESEQRPAV